MMPLPHPGSEHHDEGYLQWWATGDFNADGDEDVLVFRSLGATGATIADPAAFVLTRTQPRGVLQVLNVCGDRIVNFRGAPVVMEDRLSSRKAVLDVACQ
ncbi:hypothetical protein ACN28I_27440 [Archangium gephyra]|uniref:hypothetical protein n=1 Tax=Archangium gephyra TaxID=48 RepID=UPI003B80AC06